MVSWSGGRYAGNVVVVVDGPGEGRSVVEVGPVAEVGPLADVDGTEAVVVVGSPVGCVVQDTIARVTAATATRSFGRTTSIVTQTGR